MTKHQCALCGTEWNDKKELQQNPIIPLNPLDLELVEICEKCTKIAQEIPGYICPHCLSNGVMTQAKTMVAGFSVCVRQGLIMQKKINEIQKQMEEDIRKHGGHP